MLTQEQQRIRMGGIGGSEIGAVAGLSPFATPLEVAMVKLGLKEAFEGNEDTERGDLLEEPITQMWAKRTNTTNITSPGTMVDPEFPIIISTPDRLGIRMGKRVGGQIKAPGGFGSDWGQPGTDEVPAYVQAQAHWDMRVLGLKSLDVPAFGANSATGRVEFRNYVIAFDDEFFGMLVECGNRFWHDYVAQKKLPPASAPDMEGNLRRLFPRSQAPRLKLNELAPAAVDLLHRFKEVRLEYEELEKAHDDMRALLEQVIGDAEGIEAPWGRIDFKSQKNVTRTNWEAALSQVSELIAAQAPALLPALGEAIKAATTERPGNRPFTVRINK